MLLRLFGRLAFTYKNLLFELISLSSYPERPGVTSSDLSALIIDTLFNCPKNLLLIHLLHQRTFHHS